MTPWLANNAEHVQRAHVALDIFRRSKELVRILAVRERISSLHRERVAYFEGFKDGGGEVGLFDDDPALSGKRETELPHTPFNESGYCKFCGRPLLWVSTADDKRVPLDRDYEERWITESGTSPMRARKRRTYTLHLETCPKKGGR